MKYIIAKYAVAATLLGVTMMASAQPSTQQVTVRKVGTDTYRTVTPGSFNQQSLMIQTEFCSVQAFSDTPATLIWNGSYSYNNKLIFAGGRECRVKDLYREVR